MKYAIPILLLVVSSCARMQPETRVRSALDVLATVIDPAYELAVDGCIEREQVEVAAERAGSQTAAVTDANLRAQRARCDKVRDAFEAIRAAHIEAAERVEAGAVEDAEQKLEEVRGLWETLGQLAQ